MTDRFEGCRRPRCTGSCRALFPLFGTLLALGPLSLDAQLTVAGRPVELAVGWVGEPAKGMVRVTVDPLDLPSGPSTAAEDPYLLPQPWTGEPLRFREAGPAQTLLERAGAAATVDPETLEVRVRGAGGAEVRLAIDGATGVLTFPVGSAPLLGLGQGGQPFDRRDAVDPMVTGSGWPWHMWHFGGRVVVPWLVSAEGWGIYFNAPHYELDLRGENARARPFPTEWAGRPGDPPARSVDPLPIDVFLAAPNDPVELGGAVAQLLGPPSLPPLWSLGYQQSHRTLESADAVMSVPRTLREHRLPADILIYLGTGYVPTGWNEGHGSLAFHPDIFPDPEGMLGEMHELGFKVVMHVNRAPDRLAGTVSEGAGAEAPTGEAAGGAGGGGNGRSNWAADYWADHGPAIRAGVDGFWPDEGESMPAASKVARIRMYYEGPRLADPDARAYALFRSGFPGMQRYGGWLWTGDVWSNWDMLRKHASIGLNTSLSGIPFWGSDTGGFWTTPEMSGELFVRWFQFSAFNPIFRSHGRTWMLHLPYGWNRDSFGPEEIDPDRHPLMGLPPEDVLPDPRVEPIARKYLDLRYRLMPYLYSLVWESHEKGTPIMRPVWMHVTEDPRARRMVNEYLWGPGILVAPVTEPGAAQRSLYLPRGVWYDFWTGERLEGGREISRAVDLETMPLFVRAGAIVPMGPPEQFTAEKPNDPLTLMVHPGADGRFTLVEDDGTGVEPAPAERMTLLLSWNDRARELTVELADGSRALEPLPRTIRVRLPGEDEAASRVVQFDGGTVTVRVE